MAWEKRKQQLHFVDANHELTGCFGTATVVDKIRVHQTIPTSLDFIFSVGDTPYNNFLKKIK